jgi:hypothetical protein
MRRIVWAAISLFFLATISAAFAQSTPDLQAELLQRLASANGKADVVVGALPANLPKVPLPQATIVGSIHQTMDSPIVIDMYQLYYDAAPDALANYESALTSAGWKRRNLTGGGGFIASSGPQMAFYCKSGGPTITAQSGDDPKNLNVTINSKSDVTDLACGDSPLSGIISAMSRMPLPELHAPDGVRMSVALAAMPNQQSAAYIHNGTSAGDLLAHFASQMTSAGWQSGVNATGSGIASQSFTKTDKDHALWECVISIYAVSGKPGEFIASTSVQDVDALSKGQSTLFSR